MCGNELRHGAARPRRSYAIYGILRYWTHLDQLEPWPNTRAFIFALLPTHQNSLERGNDIKVVVCTSSRSIFPIAGVNLRGGRRGISGVVC